jgi:hypothetical protein
MNMQFATPVVLAILTAIASFFVAGAIAFIVATKRAQRRDARDRQRELLLQAVRVMDEYRRREVQADAA